MIKIEIKKEEPAGGGWHFIVGVSDTEGETEYSVTLGEDYLERMTGENENPSELVRRSFEFLLERESKDSILKSFDIRDIRRYFPEYEREIKKAVK